MQYVNLGATGLKVSRLCLGAFSFGNPAWQRWVLPEADARPVIRRAIELGINFFDTADMYSDGESEAILGRALREHARRDDVVVCTKPFHPTGPGVNERGLSRKHLFHAVDRSLSKLGMDYIDIYEIHRLDQTVPMEETLEALSDIVRSGKARYIAASNMVAWQFARALYLQRQHGWARFIAMQNQYNLVYREDEREMIPLCVAEGVAYTPYSPLARGFLARTGASPRAEHDVQIKRMYDEPELETIRARVGQVAERMKAARSQVALAWLLHQRAVNAPVIGATSARHVEDAVSALELRLEDRDVEFLREPYRPRQVLLHL
jgi:aryl-alcohol dehydrogenase (NADP+)